MPYEIRDYKSQPGWVEYVSEMTTSIEDAWTTPIPLDPEELSKYDFLTPPKQFKTKAEAKPYLDAVQAARKADWIENKWYEIGRGRCKPEFKIYKSDFSFATQPELVNG
jgi:hypothetical protein